MGKVVCSSKYSLENNNWSYDKKKVGKSFCISSYKPIINNPDDDRVNYLLIANGCRMESYTKLDLHRNREADIYYVIKKLEQAKENYIIQGIFLDNDARLLDEVNMIGDYINCLFRIYNTKSVNYLGISKCGAMGMWIPRHVDEEYRDKLNMFLCSAPFMGTVMASPEELFPVFSKNMERYLHDINFRKGLTESLKLLYKLEGSCSHMDYDIGILNKNSDISKYDNRFIKDIFCKENIEAMESVNSYYNYITQAGKGMLKNCLQNNNFYAIGLLLLNFFVMNGLGDGLVMTESQAEVLKHIKPDKNRVFNSHHNVTANPEVYSVILDDIINVAENTNNKDMTLKKN